MVIKNEDNLNAEYQTKNEISEINDKNLTNAKTKNISLKKWGLVGATLIVAGMATVTGYLYYNSYQGGLTYTTPQLEAFMVNAYNSRYETYCGKNKNLAQVKSLISLTNAHNTNETEVEKYGGKVVLESEDIITINEIGTYTADGINAKKTGFFTINSFSYDSQTGCINGIKIEYSPTRIAD